MAGATCRSRWCCRTARACRCRRTPAVDIVARSWKGLRALASPALGSLARAYVQRRPRLHRQLAAHAGHRRIDGRRGVARPRSRAREAQGWPAPARAATAATSRTTTTSPTRSTGCGWTSGWSTRAPISGATATRSMPRRCRSSTTSAASCGCAPGERFLDIGCGWGALLFHAAETLRRRRHRHHAVAKPVRSRDARDRGARPRRPRARRIARLPRPARRRRSTTRSRAWACSSTSACAASPTISARSTACSSRAAWC